MNELYIVTQLWLQNCSHRSALVCTHMRHDGSCMHRGFKSTACSHLATIHYPEKHLLCPSFAKNAFAISRAYIPVRMVKVHKRIGIQTKNKKFSSTPNLRYLDVQNCYHNATDTKLDVALLQLLPTGKMKSHKISIRLKKTHIRGYLTVPQNVFVRVPSSNWLPKPCTRKAHVHTAHHWSRHWHCRSIPQTAPEFQNLLVGWNKSDRVAISPSSTPPPINRIPSLL